MKVVAASYSLGDNGHSQIECTIYSLVALSMQTVKVNVRIEKTHTQVDSFFLRVTPAFYRTDLMKKKKYKAKIT